MPNRLANESSPYLRQHADNPVEWWPWGEPAFAEAKRLDKPVFVSIGYAACHWCHVMAHESFEDAATAKLMNELFVCVKVDREERPDVDTIFMNAIMVMGEGGGWPLSAFCLPDGRPYYLGTYYPAKPRFGRPSFSDFLRARASRVSFGEAARAAVDGWARGMAEGGIYDHLGGGFARYSVDAKWLVPHFEKMLYDNAQLLGIYASVVQMGGPLASRAVHVIDETVGFLARELSDPAGGLWSSLDADSEGEEGKFYVWTPAEVRAVLGPANALVFEAAYGVTEHGNFEHGAPVLSRVTPRVSPAEEEHLAELRGKLRAARAARVRPGTDDKVLAAWNGLAISGLVAAWRATQHAPALAMAQRGGAFLRDHMVQGDRIARVFHEGKTKDLDGTLDDYAFCAQAYLELAAATGDRTRWDLGAKLLGGVRARFVEERDGVVIFYLAPAGDSLLVRRPESPHDAAIPSGAAVATHALLRLGLVAGDQAALALAEKYLAQRLAGTTGVNAWATSALMAALDLYLHAKVLVAVGPNRDALLAAARKVYAPTLSIARPWSVRRAASLASVASCWISHSGAALA